MIFQSATNESIDLIADLAGVLHWTCSTSQIVTGDGSAVPGTHGSLTTIGPVTISAAPAASEHRQVGLILIHNAGDAKNKVSVRKMVGGTPFTLVSESIAPGETLQYAKEEGFRVLRDTSQKTVKPPVLAVSTIFSKANINTQLAGRYSSLWLATGLPAQGAVPTAAAVCDNVLLGALPLPPRTGSQKRLLTGIFLSYSSVGVTGIVEDRLAHMGGLSGTVATAQTINLDVSGSTGDLPARIGSPDYSNVVWFMEWYTATGASAVTPSFAVTHGDGTTGTAKIYEGSTNALPASMAASRRYQIIADSGKPIKSIQSLTQATTGTAGNIGVTAVRFIAQSLSSQGSRVEPVYIPLEKAVSISDNACISLSVLNYPTSTGTVIGNVEFSVVE